MSKNSQKKDLPLQEKPKVGEFYKANGFAFKIISVDEENAKYIWLKDNLNSSEQRWAWTKYPCEKLTLLEVELL